MAAAMGSKGGSLSPGQPMTLFAANFGLGRGVYRPPYHVGKDGRFLVNLELTAAATPPITLPMNWKPPRLTPVRASRRREVLRLTLPAPTAHHTMRLAMAGFWRTCNSPAPLPHPIAAAELEAAAVIQANKRRPLGSGIGLSQFARRFEPLGDRYLDVGKCL